MQDAFDQAVSESNVKQALEDYYRERKIRLQTPNSQFLEIAREWMPKALVNVSDVSALFDWDDLYNTSHFFYPEAFLSMMERLFAEESPILSTSMDAATIEFIISYRFGVSESLFAGLGWSRAKRLPGYCGNMFIPPDELESTLVDIEAIFRDVSREEFFARAQAVVGRGIFDLDQLFLLPLLLDKILKQGDGFLALNYYSLGSFPFPDCKNLEQFLNYS